MSEDHLSPFDITLVVKDGKEFQAHRNVLSQASPFFEKLLNSDMKENNEGIIRLDWIIESQMADILQFIYTGNVQISTQENAEDLIQTADYLLLSKLKALAGKSVEQHMTTVNCISIYYSVAEQYSCEELIACTRKFINSKFTTVAVTKDFLNLPSHEIEKWISSDDIVIDTEENVFKIIIRWIHHEKSERSKKFSELFRHVRLTTISRDILLSDVVAHELVKENEDCLESVTAALKWFDQSTDCDVPRPHSPRKAMETGVIVIKELFDEVPTCCYVPATDKWYRLPATESKPSGSVGIFSFCGKVFVVTDDIDRSQCYDPDLNRWSPAPWSRLDSNVPFDFDTSTLQEVLVVKNIICFIQAGIGPTALWRYSFDSNSFTPLFNWVKRASVCALAVEKYIYAIGGVDNHQNKELSESLRFDIEADEWQKIAPLNEARKDAFGVCKNEKIFIAGGERKKVFLETCEVYNILTDEWQFIASLTLGRTLGRMVLVDETLYVLGGIRSEHDVIPEEFSDRHVESYDDERDEWFDNTVVSVTTEEARFTLFDGCSLRVFKDVLNDLESIE